MLAFWSRQDRDQYKTLTRFHWEQEVSFSVLLQDERETFHKDQEVWNIRLKIVSIPKRQHRDYIPASSQLNCGSCGGGKSLCELKVLAQLILNTKCRGCAVAIVYWHNRILLSRLCCPTHTQMPLLSLDRPVTCPRTQDDMKTRCNL